MSSKDIIKAQPLKVLLMPMLATSASTRGGFGRPLASLGLFFQDGQASCKKWEYPQAIPPPHTHDLPIN